MNGLVTAQGAKDVTSQTNQMKISLDSITFNTVTPTRAPPGFNKYIGDK